MKTNQNGFTPVIIVLAIVAILIIGGTGAWYYSQTAKPKPAPPNPTPAANQQPVVPPSTGQSNSQTERTDMASPATTMPPNFSQPGNQQTKTPSQMQQKNSTDTNGWKTYKNDQYGFQINYPLGTQMDNDETSGENMFLTFPSQTAGFSFKLPPVRVIAASEGKGNNCPPYNFNDPSLGVYTVNGINFTKTDISGAFAGMEHAGVAASYCIVHNGVVYDLQPQIYYNRKQEAAPDKKTSFQQFDQLMQALNFQFTDQAQNQITQSSVCGNMTCEIGEDVFSCPQDCPQVDKSVTELIPPSNVDISACTDGSGNTYPTEGASNYARWFVWNDCVAKKMFVLSSVAGGTVNLNGANQPLILYVYGDNCATCKCHNPNFDIYEVRGDGAYKLAGINLSNNPTSSSTGPTSNVHSYFYAPKSYAIYIGITAHSCFYLKVYQGDEASLKRNFPAWENLPVNVQGPIPQ